MRVLRRPLLPVLGVTLLAACAPEAPPPAMPVLPNAAARPAPRPRSFVRVRPAPRKGQADEAAVRRDQPEDAAPRRDQPDDPALTETDKERLFRAFDAARSNRTP